ncbi:helix-turn-helix domain-containing protein [Brevibacillus porteri]
MQKLMVMDVDALIKEVRAYRELLNETKEEKTKLVERVRFDLPSVDEEILDAYPDALKPKDIQNILGLGPVKTYELLNSGEFHVVRVGRSYMISKRVFLNWLKGQ